MAVLLCAAVLFGFGGCGSRRTKTVGTDVKQSDVTDFYYTVSSSTNPPSYQRYRFYAENGAHFFFHETREGDHWPLTEADATASGTVELSEDQWNAFFACVSGGTVRNREEHTESGGSGPWLYLYWNGDRSKTQEYAFASLEKRAAFEELCAGLAGHNDTK